MMEDKLSRYERVRLEALAQAVARATMQPTKRTDEVLQDAKKFAGWIENGDLPS